MEIIHTVLWAQSVGTFKPNDETNPYIGNNNVLEFVEEDKSEVVCNYSIIKQVLDKIREVHPYEEPEIDVIPLIDEKYFK